MDEHEVGFCGSGPLGISSDSPHGQGKQDEGEGGEEESERKTEEAGEELEEGGNA